MKSYSLVVIGAGAAGLVIAIGFARAGKKVLLVERGNWGGDCTNFGCIPSKSLIASARAAHVLKAGSTLGLEFNGQSIGTEGVLKRVRRIVSDVRSYEDPEALAKLGVETLTERASFEDSHTLRVGAERIRFGQCVIATGSMPFIPQISGLDQTPYLTNETLFNLEVIPKSLAVMGAGPIGCEMAQAFGRLGSQVFLIHTHNQLLNKEDPKAQAVIAEQFAREGIALHLGSVVQAVSHANGRFSIDLRGGPRIETEALLVSVGRRPRLFHLNLEAAGVQFSDKGIFVDAYGRTNQRHIWAVGDVTGAPFFTHFAENQARTVLTSLFLPFKKSRMSKQPLPRVTFTDPEVASVGLMEEEAAKKMAIATYVVPFSALDRAVTEGRTEGFVKVVTSKWSSRIVGCTIVGPRAGEMLSQVTTAMLAGLPLRKLSGLIHPYPTYSLAVRKAADLWLTQTLFSLFKRRKK
jgi:pyruvate/2-oxoglutarate dehydrogenase complex dihydrolipoamide dehydrogenase (E3) component